MRKNEKGVLNDINELYNYYKITKTISFDNNVKKEFAKEIHYSVLGLIKKYYRSEKNKDIISMGLMELCEQMILDNIDKDLTVKEVAEYDK